MSRRRTKAEHDHAFWSQCHADDVLAVIKHKLEGSVWRGDLMHAHRHLVYEFAHIENERFDRNALWLAQRSKAETSS